MTILCYGEIDLDIYVALDRLPTMERWANCVDEFENIGGAAANSALWLANWGLPTRLAGHDIGDDRAGDVFQALLPGDDALDTRFINCHAGYVTPRCQCLVTPDGERSFIGHWPPELRVAPATAEMLEGVSWLNLDMSGPLAPRLAAAELAKAKGIPVLINDIYETEHQLLPLTDALVLSADIIRNEHAESSPLELARALQEAGDCDVVVTNGRGELTVLAHGGAVESFLPPRVQALDTTGAGDTFKSGLLYGLLQDLPLLEAAKWGAAAGSLMCQYAGTTQTLASIDAVAALKRSIE